jgi:hypothetical protein
LQTASKPDPEKNCAAGCVKPPAAQFLGKYRQTDLHP